MEPINIIAAMDLVLVLIAGIFIYRSPLVDNERKWLQLLFSVLLPYIGPIFTIIVHLSDITKPGFVSKRYYGQSIDEAPWDVKLYYMTHPNER